MPNQSASPRVSIIVPVYCAEQYLHRCVDSLLAQTLQDFEVILVDDGSPDRSGAMCDEYAARDARVRVIHKANGGVSAARQDGIEAARGEYSIHADPDDYVESRMLEELVAEAERTGADMVLCDFFEDADDRVIYHKQQPTSLAPAAVRRELFQQLHGSCWNKLVRRACYSAHGVRFPEGLSYCEDLLFNYAVLQHCQRVAYVPRAFYHYVQNINPNSLCETCTLETYLRLLDAVKRELPWDEFRCFYANYAYAVSVRVLRHGIYPKRKFRREHRDLLLNAWLGNQSKQRFVYKLKFLLWALLP